MSIQFIDYNLSVQWMILFSVIYSTEKRRKGLKWWWRTNLHQLLFELLDLGDIKLAQQVVHEAGRRMEQLLLLGRGDAVVVGDGIGQFREAILITVESLVVVGLSGGIVAELETIQRNAKRAEVKEWEQCVI